MWKINIHIQASLYLYGTPYSYSDYFPRSYMYSHKKIDAHNHENSIVDNWQPIPEMFSHVLSSQHNGNFKITTHQWAFYNNGMSGCEHNWLFSYSVWL